MNNILVKLAFVLLVTSPIQEKQANILIKSIREFGGNYAGSPVYIFVSDTVNSPCRSLDGQNITLIPLDLNATLPQYPFLEKVLACAKAEDLLKGKTENLVWIDSDALVLNEPDEFCLGKDKKIAIRPVNLRNNVGLLADEPANIYWQKIYGCTGLKADKRVMQLNDLQSVIYERIWDLPGGIQGVIKVDEPLISWLIEADTTGNYADVKHAIEQSIGWAIEKDFEAMYSLWADNMFHFWLTSDSKIIGLDDFKKYSEVWKDPGFRGTRFEFRDLRIVFSQSGEVAWYSCFLDDCGSFNGKESCLIDVFQTGVLEKRDGRWVHVLMHGAYPIDKIPENYVRHFYSKLFEGNNENE